MTLLCCGLIVSSALMQVNNRFVRRCSINNKQHLPAWGRWLIRKMMYKLALVIRKLAGMAVAMLTYINVAEHIDALILTE